MRRALLLVLVLAGCTGAPPVGTTPSSVPHYVEPPLPGGTWVEPCLPQDAQPIAVDFRAIPLNDSKGHPPGVHRLDGRTFLWVYASYQNTERQDRVSRVGTVHVARASSGEVVICTQVDVITPVQVDGKLRTFDVAARFEAPAGLPEGPVRFTVNWVAGCTPCDPIPRGNTTATFEP
jgi:hypothetical protein